jgi:hypothetical protein
MENTKDNVRNRRSSGDFLGFDLRRVTTRAIPTEESDDGIDIPKHAAKKSKIVSVIIKNDEGRTYPVDGGIIKVIAEEIMQPVSSGFAHLISASSNDSPVYSHLLPTENSSGTEDIQLPEDKRQSPGRSGR